MSKPSCLLLVTDTAHPWHPFLAAGLGLLARGTGIFPAVYAAAPRGGGIFAPHGGSVAGAQHHLHLARLLASHRTTVLRHGGVRLFADLTAAGAEQEHLLPDDGAAALIAIAAQLRVPLPEMLLAVQTRDLPTGLAHGIAPYVLPRARALAAVPAPLSCTQGQIASLRAAGARTASTIATVEADTSPWTDAGITVHADERLAATDIYGSLTFRLAGSGADGGGAIELAEPILAADRLCTVAFHGGTLVIDESLEAGATRVAELCRARGQVLVDSRYGGGPVGGARSDLDLFPLFRAGISLQVREPGRIPALPRAPALPQRGQGSFACEPDDAELYRWIAAGLVPTTVITHSGELSHDECLPAVYEACSHVGLRLGIGMHRQRYEEDPDAIDQLLCPVAHGGVAELAEPLLHSSGEGVIAERVGPPTAVARTMARCRERIRALVGDAATPRGVYCYLDADHHDWASPAVDLWKAIRDAGFSYVISSVAPGAPRVLWSDGDFTVLNQTCGNEWPYSPFIRAHRGSDFTTMIANAADLPGPRWAMAAIDLPVVADTTSLLFGDRYRADRPQFGGIASALTRGLPKNAVNTTPHVIARYARLAST